MEISPIGTGGTRRRFWGLAALFILLLGFVVAPRPAVAQSNFIDWLVNVNDAAFEDLPAGGTIEYEVSVDNNGDLTTPTTTLEFIVPAGTTFEGAVAPASGKVIGNCTPATATAGAVVSCDVPSLDPVSGAGDVDSSSVTLLIKTTMQGVVQLAVDVRDDMNVDIDDTNNDLTETTTVFAGSDIGVVLTAPASAASGSIIPLDIVATNYGPDPSNGFDVVFSTPPGVTDIVVPAG